MSEALPAHEALRLTHRLQQTLNHDIFFAQVLVNSAADSEIAMLRSLIKRANDFYSNPMTPEQRRQYNNLKTIDRGLLNRPKPKIRAQVRRRLFKVDHR
jgi:hypothetical protein